jgi:hypothetical protein
MQRKPASAESAHETLQRLYERRIKVSMAIESLEQLRLLRDRQPTMPSVGLNSWKQARDRRFQCGSLIAGQHPRHKERAGAGLANGRATLRER